MKKRVPVYLLIIVVLILAFSLWKNYSYSSEKEHLRNNMLSTTLSSLKNISTDLEDILIGLENSTPYEECEDKLIRLSNEFAELHFALTTYATYFPPTGKTRNCYPSIISFDFIGRTLVGGWGEINGNRYDGIMFDNTITDKEVQYLTELKKSADNMIEAITKKDSLNQLTEISPSYLDEVIRDFTEKYFTAYDDSPLRLLFE